MSLSKKAIEEFKKLCKKIYGEKISDYVASEAANRLVDFYKVIYKPMTKGEFQRFEERRKATKIPDEPEISESGKVDLVGQYIAEARCNERKLNKENN